MGSFLGFSLSGDLVRPLVIPFFLVSFSLGFLGVLSGFIDMVLAKLNNISQQNFSLTSSITVKKLLS
jgi:hypothetical protein